MMRRTWLTVAWGLVWAGVGLTATARGDVKLPNALSDHMVLQRDMAVPIWGTASPDERVTVRFRQQEKMTTADKAGKWSVKLDALQAGGPDKLTVVGTNTIVLEDVLVGEVWVGSGQSNMQGAVGAYAKNDPGLTRLVEAAPYAKVRLLKGGAGGRWQEATSPNINQFSALLFAFGVKLHQDLDVPVGLIVGAVGGTPSGYWLSEEAFKGDAACQAAVAKYAATFNLEQAMKKYEADLAAWQKLADEAKKDNKQPPRKPTPPARPGEANGNKIGNLYAAHIQPYIPYAMKGVLWDQGESGTAINGVDQYTLMGALIQGWRKEWGQGEFPFIYIQKPSGGGCAWDPANPVTSKSEPFTPLPPAVPPTQDGAYRDLHIKIMNHPRTAMAISSDLGPGVHPTNKSGYGARAEQVALGMVYNKPVEYYGPVYKSHQVEGNKVIVSYTHIGQGLAQKHGDKLQGFAIAGEDKVFHWADATITGDTVTLTSDKVTKPVAIRYGYASRPTWANLFNKDGLPAIPFRTDNW